MSFTPSSTTSDPDDAALLWSFLNSLSNPSATEASSTKQTSDDAAALIGVLHRANAAQSPATRLYSHALESIFGFCSLVDLLSAAATHREWRRAVPKMRCLRATLQLKHFTRQLHTVWVTQVAPHITALEPSWDAKNAEIDAPLLAQLAQHMPHLESLSCEMLLLCSSTGDLVWPAKLRSLSVSFPSGPHVNTNWLIRTQTTILRSCTTLPMLESLELSFPVHSPQTDFSLLSECKALRNLTWSWRDNSAKLTELQTQALSRLSALQRLRLPWIASHLLPLLTAAPDSLKWISIGRWDDPSAAINLGMIGELLVSRVPQLTELTALSSSLQWLPLCRNLASLSLAPVQRGQFMVIDGVLCAVPQSSFKDAAVALSQCLGLTCLSIREVGFPEESLCTVLRHLPQLHTLLLTLGAVPATLDGICSSAPALRRLELTAAVSWGVRSRAPRDASLLAPLLALRSLEECKLVRWVPVPDAELWYRHVQQTQSMPRLTKFIVKQA